MSIGGVKQPSNNTSTKGSAHQTAKIIDNIISSILKKMTSSKSNPGSHSTRITDSLSKSRNIASNAQTTTSPSSTPSINTVAWIDVMTTGEIHIQSQPKQQERMLQNSQRNYRLNTINNFIVGNLEPNNQIRKLPVDKYVSKFSVEILKGQIPQSTAAEKSSPPQVDNKPQVRKAGKSLLVITSTSVPSTKSTKHQDPKLVTSMPYTNTNSAGLFLDTFDGVFSVNKNVRTSAINVLSKPTVSSDNSIGQAISDKPYTEYFTIKPTTVTFPERTTVKSRRNETLLYNHVSIQLTNKNNGNPSVNNTKNLKLDSEITTLPMDSIRGNTSVNNQSVKPFQISLIDKSPVSNYFDTPSVNTNKIITPKNNTSKMVFKGLPSDLPPPAMENYVTKSSLSNFTDNPLADNSTRNPSGSTTNSDKPPGKSYHRKSSINNHRNIPPVKDFPQTPLVNSYGNKTLVKTYPLTSLVNNYGNKPPVKTYPQNTSVNNYRNKPPVKTYPKHSSFNNYINNPRMKTNPKHSLNNHGIGNPPFKSYPEQSSVNINRGVPPVDNITRRPPVNSHRKIPPLTSYPQGSSVNNYRGIPPVNNYPNRFPVKNYRANPPANHYYSVPPYIGKPKQQYISGKSTVINYRSKPLMDESIHTGYIPDTRPKISLIIRGNRMDAFGVSGQISVHGA